MLDLVGTHPDRGDHAHTQAVSDVERVLAAVGVPLVIVKGPGAADKQNEVLVAVAEATGGSSLALGVCEEKDYRTHRRGGGGLRPRRRSPRAPSTSTSPSR